jgi:hypothetical protein
MCQNPPSRSLGFRQPRRGEGDAPQTIGLPSPESGTRLRRDFLGNPGGLWICGSPDEQFAVPGDDSLRALAREIPKVRSSCGAVYAYNFAGVALTRVTAPVKGKKGVSAVLGRAKSCRVHIGLTLSDDIPQLVDSTQSTYTSTMAAPVFPSSPRVRGPSGRRGSFLSDRSKNRGRM